MNIKFKKILCVLLISVLCLGTLSGCSSRKIIGEINLFIWTSYIPDSVLELFQEETGIRVNCSTFSSNEDMLAKVKSEVNGTYDIITPSDYMVLMMIKQGMLEEIDLTKLSNLSNIDEFYMNEYYDENNKYSVPFFGGVATLCVNKKKISEEITSFSQIFDNKYENSMVALDDMRAVIGLAAKSLGYSISETDDTKLTEIKNRLLQLKPIIKAYDSDSPKSSMIDGSTSLGYMWAAEIALSMRENPNIEIVFPEEGMYRFMDNLCIPKGSKNAEYAHQFIDFILRADVAKMIAEEFPYLCPNKAALEILDEEFVNNPAANPPKEIISKAEYTKEVGNKLSVYDAMWTELKK